MYSKFYSIPLQRPVAICMFFLAMALLGIYSWQKISIELIPALSGDQLYIKYFRPGSEPDVIEREILIPLESRIKQLPGITKTWGEIVGNSGSLNIEFQPGTNYRIRELELRRISADLSRSQPEGTIIRVNSQDTTALSRFVMSVQILGGDDTNVLRDIVEERIQPVLESIEGVSQIFIFGGSSREVSVLLDAKKCAELGVRVSEVTLALSNAVGELHYLGSTEEEQQRYGVVIDERPKTISFLKNIKVTRDSPIFLSDVANIEISSSPQTTVSRVNGQPSVSIVVFKEQGSNLVELGQRLSSKLNSLKKQINPYNLDLIVGFDASEQVSKQLNHLKRLAASGFSIALVVLFLFLKSFRAVLVVAIAVPMSLLIAGSFLYLAGYTLNLFTLFGLVIGVGMLVDNSIVVHEAVQRNLERGVSNVKAAVIGIQRTIRAIITASATNAIVFLPLVYFQEIPLTVRLALDNIVPAILFPLTASLIVAIGLVPLLACKLVTVVTARPPKVQFITKSKSQPLRKLLLEILKVSLRQPRVWVLGIFSAIALTIVFAVPWVLVQTIAQPPAEASQVRVEVEFIGGGSLEAAGLVFKRLEQSIADIEGIQRVESNYQEEQGSLTVYLEEEEQRPQFVDAALIRKLINDSVDGLGNVQLKAINDNSLGNTTSTSNIETAQIAISGPNMEQLNRLAEQIKQRLNSIKPISSATIESRISPEELYVKINDSNLTGHLLYSVDALETLLTVGREGQRISSGFNLPNGREIPIVVRNQTEKKILAIEKVKQIPVLKEASVLALSELVEIDRRPAPLAITHQNGRRELRVSYQLNEYAPRTGPERIALEEQINNLVQQIYRPDGYTIGVIAATESTDWFKVIIIPILLLLYALLAVSFESFTMPILILVTVPLTIIGAVWGLLIAGLGVDMIAVIGVVVLLGLTVNPAILLVDRMQQMLRGHGGSAGRAAMTAVHERVRPVLMTSSTTIAGLSPLALAQGNALEMWPPFATVVIGGLVTSTFLTLLAIPIGFVALSKLDRIISILGPWKLFLWITTTVMVVTPILMSRHFESFAWQATITISLAVLFFFAFIKLFISQKVYEFEDSEVGLEVRYLSKIYNKLPPVRNAWRLVITSCREPKQESNQELKNSIITLGSLFAGTLYLAINLQEMIWNIGFSYLAGFMAYFAIMRTRLLLGKRSISQTKYKEPSYSGIELVLIVPWIVLTVLAVNKTALPLLAKETPSLHPALLTLLVLCTLAIQLGRKTAKALSGGSIKVRLDQGKLRVIRGAWRSICLYIFGLDLPRQEFTALSSLNFSARTGLIGVLGPNGAGKTTLLRLISNVIDSSAGTIYFNDVEKKNLGQNIGRLIGYLPQEFGLPAHLTGREYLDYFALLYEVGNQLECNSRIEQLLIEVGLEKEQHKKISEYSGGMRQRVAVARTLLLKPPIIIVDEPTAGLDPRERIRFRNLLSNLAKDRVILFSTHVIEDVAVSCDRVIVLKRGSIVYDGTPMHLASLAKNKIWQVILPKMQVNYFEQTHNVIQQMPDGVDRVNLRVLSEVKPHKKADIVESSLEDGYFQLFNQTTTSHE